MEGTYHPDLEDRMLAETICSAAAVAGLGIAAITAYRKRFLAAARIAAYSLVPLGLVMIGAVDWIAGTAFSPVAWAGFGVLGGAWLLFSSTRAVERRRGGRKETTGGAEPRAVAPAASSPSRAAAPKPQAGQSAGEDFSDIEAILKKHGI
ncbi:hypothetical protein GCM10017674_37930 [Streptomyces gardneri]|uniref:Uncharacterized protein n=2 Tax=Streptomyces gardneri TaxID=66892 RepID=A0A4Y3S0E7_9ACTN|nr:hypothetical protein SGA01_80720 [Streptomyces gardneri]GHH01582.1 hypothetical protein GCM10017674_37930 [Streptomyces gardneri]